MNVDVLPEIDVLRITESFSEYLLQFMADLKNCAASDLQGADELKAKFLESAQEIAACRFEDLKPEDGAFVIEGNVIVFNLQPILAILRAVLADVEEQMEVGRVLDQTEILQLQREALVVYALHEIRHVSQGLTLKESVDKVKHISGSQKVSDFDLQADCDAVFAYAMVRGGEKWSEEYFDYYKRALFFSSQYFFKAFEFSIDRIEKFSRAIGIILMQARFALLEFGCSGNDLPLDVPIFVNIDQELNMNVFVKCPDERYLATVSANDNQDLFVAVQGKAYDEALIEGVKMIRRIGMG